MTMLEHVRVTELQETVTSLHLPDTARLTIIVEEEEQETGGGFNRDEVLKTMEELKGSGNGKLLDALLEDRRKEALL